MCSVCGFPAAAGHWTETGGASPTDRLRSRYRRAQVLNSVLRDFGLTAHDDGLVPGVQIGTMSGSVSIARDLDEVWCTVERMLGQPIDPLDARFIGQGDG